MKEYFHPRTVFIYLGACFLMALIYQEIMALAALFIIMLVLNCALDRCRSLVKILSICLPLLLLIAAVNIYCNTEGQIIWAVNVMGFKLAVHQGAVYYSLSMGLRLIVVFSIFTSFNLILAAEDLLEVFPGRPGNGVLLLAITARLIPEMAQRSRSIMEMQEMRGKSLITGNVWQRTANLGLFLINLLRAALGGAWHSAEAMHARAFGFGPRSTYKQVSFRLIDKWVIATTAAALVLALAVQLWLGTLSAADGKIPLMLWGELIPLGFLTYPVLLICQGLWRRAFIGD
nr:energy-coupling factor transporter transmembrane component T [Syntrophomonas palmitatica]